MDSSIPASLSLYHTDLPSFSYLVARWLPLLPTGSRLRTVDYRWHQHTSRRFVCTDAGLNREWNRPSLRAMSPLPNHHFNPCQEATSAGPPTADTSFFFPLVFPPPGSSEFMVEHPPGPSPPAVYDQITAQNHQLLFLDIFNGSILTLQKLAQPSA